MLRLAIVAFVLSACGPASGGNGGDDDGGGSSDGGAGGDGGNSGNDAGADLDGGRGGDGDGGGHDGSNGGMDAPSGVISGGPCLSGATGATAYRIRWAGNGSGSTAYPVYEVNGFPVKTGDHAGAYGYQIGYTPVFEDVFLAQGGLRLDGSNFVDLELTTIGIASISTATLALYGRSFNTTASGSFNWQSWDGTGSTPTNFVSNSAPYEWYPADMTTEISPGDDGVRIRIKAGPSSGSLIVHRIELCLQAS
ncbi:MAG: hypothetical protein SFX73_17370 [Kofleriaceae bacterium]|nr:hypothetical protein [Kofleriaceae bacterium]